MRLLIYTDSRGQHTPRGAPVHDVFATRLAALPQVEAQVFLCPMKWTTTIDFLELLETHPPQDFDHVVLYTGIVDWSPRPQQSAIRDLYDNAAPENLGNRALNTPAYDQKVANSKKAVFDRIFGEPEMRAHLARDFGVSYEGGSTTNMYSLRMAQRSLLPVLAAIPNLTFVNSNRFVPGWEGDYARGRPANISITERYAALFRDAMPDRTVDLLQWSELDVQQFTCDNLHLTKAGSDWIYERLCERLSLATRPLAKPAAAPRAPAPKPRRIKVNRDSDEVALLEFRQALESESALRAFFDKRIASPPAIEGFPRDHADRGYAARTSFLFDDGVLARLAAYSADILDDEASESIVERISTASAERRDYLRAAFEVYKERWRSEYRLLAPLKLDTFPYNYLGAYAFSHVARTSPPRPITIDFIYCIKNRRRRTAASIASLSESAEAYRRAGGRLLTCRAVVAEDASSSMFDPKEAEAAIEIDHYIVHTGQSWTRSGLLNVGIKASQADVVASIDADFMFHEGFVAALDRVIERVDPTAQFFAGNCIETEAHLKSGIVHAKGSPYGYMWMAPRQTAVAVAGYDEGYDGHGFEDRDFELKLTRLANLVVGDTMTVDPDCVVLHLSHTSRDGFEKHVENRARFAARQKIDPLNLVQDSWGEQTRLQARRYLPGGKSERLGGDKRTLFMVISCQPYQERRDLLKDYYERMMRKGDLAIYVVAGADRTDFDADTLTLSLAADDKYEGLPEKVLKGVAYCAQNFDFEHLIKVDDDVIVNFDVLYEILDGVQNEYFGKMTPSKRGAKPSETWHFDKVSPGSRFHQKRFVFDGGPPHWCTGGMYRLGRVAAASLARVEPTTDASTFLYEDHMVGSLLTREGIEPAFIGETAGLSHLNFITPDLRDVMSNTLDTIKRDVLAATASVHCGQFPPYYAMPYAKSLKAMKSVMRAVAAQKGSGRRDRVVAHG